MRDDERKKRKKLLSDIRRQRNDLSVCDKCENQRPYYRPVYAKNIYIHDSKIVILCAGCVDYLPFGNRFLGGTTE